MIEIYGSIPKKLTLAFSGGVDSVFAADFLLRGRKELRLAFFDHGTPTSREAFAFAIKFSQEKNLHLDVGRITKMHNPSKSPEEHWRDERYAFFSSIDGPVATAHHLDDVVETWIFSSLHGKPKLIPPSRGNVIRPFLLTKKQEILSWARRHNLQWIEDATNSDEKYMRNLIRQSIVPQALRVNPGLHKVLKRQYKNQSLKT